MTKPRNPTYMRRRELRLMCEEQLRAQRREQLALAEDMQTLLRLQHEYFINDQARADRMRLGQVHLN